MAQPHQLVRHKAGKGQFEVATHPGTVLKWRKGEEQWANVPFADAIFKNFSKGERAKAEDLKAAFETDNVDECMKIICQKGTVAENAAERKEKTDKKRNEIVNYIHKYYINPQTNTPHPAKRIELALEEMKARIDPELPTEKQAHDILKKMVEILPLKKSEMEGTLKIPHKHLGAGQGVVAKWAQKKSESYDSEGCTMEVSIVPGDYDAFMNDLVRASKGEIVFDIAGQKAQAGASTDGDDGGKGKGKGRGKGKK
eukprot:Opistho-1_new@6491